MQVDFSVELGADDPVLDVPWAAPQGGLRYYDLKAQPELLLEIEEAMREPAMGEFLTTTNSPLSCLQTVKCDVWPSQEINPEEEIYGAACKFGSYVDLIFADEAPRFSFARHEALAARLTTLLKKVPEIAAAVEFIVRRCYYAEREGFYITCYCFGYGADEPAAHKQWTIALKLVENAIMQLSREG